MSLDGPDRVRDVDAYRHVIGRFATGVAVVTVRHQGRHFAMTTNSITSVSLDPIMLLVCFKHGSDTAFAVRETQRFGVSVLSATRGEELSRRFARKLTGSSEDQLAEIATIEGPDDVPLLPHSIAHIVCDVENFTTAGDHDIAFGHVRFCELHDEQTDPIIFYAGGYRRLVPVGKPGSSSRSS